jgi:hypothetical protein
VAAVYTAYLANSFKFPPEVEAALKVDSDQIKKVRDIFVALLEQGLAAEPNP